MIEGKHKSKEQGMDVKKGHQRFSIGSPFEPKVDLENLLSW
jgi:hypothetical protein